MTAGHAGDGALPPELEAIAAAAHDRLHAQAGQDLSAEQARGSASPTPPAPRSRPASHSGLG